MRNHDTRFCYMGERRLRVLEEALVDGMFVLGVDSHTALVLDLDAGTAEVHGLGGVTVRVAGRSTTFPSGAVRAIADLAAAADALRAGTGGTNLASTVPVYAASSRPVIVREPERGLEDVFLEALDDRDIPAAVQALLELDTAVAARQRSGEDSLDLDAAWGTLRSLIVRLGEVAEAGVGDPRATLDPFVSTLLDIRARARAARDWETADLVRTRLTGAGVEVRDDQDASSWILRERVAS